MKKQLETGQSINTCDKTQGWLAVRWVRSHEERRCSILGPTQSRISPSVRREHIGGRRRRERRRRGLASWAYTKVYSVIYESGSRRKTRHIKDSQGQILALAFR